MSTRYNRAGAGLLIFVIATRYNRAVAGIQSCGSGEKGFIATRYNRAVAGGKDSEPHERIRAGAGDSCGSGVIQDFVINICYDHTIQSCGSGALYISTKPTLYKILLLIFVMATRYNRAGAGLLIFVMPHDTIVR